MYDIIVVGAGPAGLTAALYACRADKLVLVIEKETFGGQITYSPRVENYPGFLSMSGNEFADKLMEQVMEQGAEIEMDTVEKITGEPGNFKVICAGESYNAKSVIIAAGSKHRRLGLEKEDLFTGEGVSYCAVCDGAFYKDKEVAVIGGGNSALQEAVLLSDICSKVYVIQNLDFMTGEGKLIAELEGRENVTFITGTVVKELVGEKSLNSVVLQKVADGSKTELNLDGIFVCIGQQPENEPFGDILDLDERGYIISGEDCLPSGAVKGIFTAGDCRVKSVRQVATAISDGAIAALGAARFVDEL